MGQGTRRRVFLRSLLLQAWWNDAGMQNIGFAWSLEPWLKDLHGVDAPAAMRRHLGMFNTQPYMAGFALGVAGKIESDMAAGRIDVESGWRRLGVVKGALGSALAGIGDPLFWGTLRPLCAALAILPIPWLRVWVPRESGIIPIVLYLTLFNVAGVSLRWRGLALGYNLGEGVVGWLQARPWQRVTKALRWTGLFAAAALLVETATPGFDWMLRAAGNSDLDVLRWLVEVCGILLCLSLKALRVKSLPAYGALIAAGTALGVLGG